MGVGLGFVSALWCAPRVVFSVPAAGPAYSGVLVSDLEVTPDGSVYITGMIENGMIHYPTRVSQRWAAGRAACLGFAPLDCSHRTGASG